MRLQGGQQSNVAIQPQPLGTVDINATRQAKSNNSSTGREGPALIRELSGKNGPNDQASDPLPQQNFMTKDRLLEGGFRNFSNALSAGPKSCCFKSKIDHESQRSAEAIYLNPASLTDDLTRLSSPDSHNDLYPQNSPTQLKNFSLSSHQTDSPQANHQMHSISNQATQYKMSSTSATTSYPSHPGQIADLQQGTDSPAANTRECTQGFRDSEPPPDGSTMFNPAHNCNCGDSCTCLGCAAHPYNNTTKSHVQWLGQILEEGDNDSQLDSPPHSLPGNSPTFIDIHNVFAGSAPPRVGDLPSPPTEVQQFPHFEAINQVDFLPDRHHGELVQPMFPSSGYYTMEFPIELNGSNFGCTDIGGSCQCDSECTCIGCLTHTGHDGDTISLEPASLDEILCESTEPVVATQDLSQDRTSDEPLQSPSYQQRTTLEDSDFA
ncbi:hypothetical protein MMC20_005603 [Loxospora ochrophaea]|nr:hypothetical protein [Loxospora ochrophaea]